MKKITSALLAIILLTSLSSCDTDKEEGNTDKKANGDITFTEETVIDNDECSVKIKGIDPENTWGYTLEALLENKSEETNYMFSVKDASVNGVSCDPFFASEVAAGKKANKNISFSTDELEKNNVGDFTDIRLTFSVYDNDDWTADPVAYETVHIYPYGEEKAVKYSRKAKNSDVIISDTEFATVVLTGFEDDEFWGYTANMFIINKTDKNITVSVDDVSVNGLMIDPFYADTVAADECAFSQMSWSDEDFEENDIEEVETIELTLNIYDSDNWLGDYFVSDKIVINP